MCPLKTPACSLFSNDPHVSCPNVRSYELRLAFSTGEAEGLKFLQYVRMYFLPLLSMDWPAEVRGPTDFISGSGEE